MNSSSISLLASGNSLGAYVPAMHLHTYLQERGVRAEVHVLENLYHEEVRRKIRSTKQAFHADFAVALMGHKLAKPVDSSLDEEEVQRLLDAWEREGVSRFAVFTGFWLPILERYKTMARNPLDIRLIRLDAWDSPSFKVHKNLYPGYHNDWFYEPSQLSPMSYIASNETEPLPYAQREGGILVHGGGWGIGTYASTISELQHRGYRLDVIVYDPSEVEEDDGVTRYFGTEATWEPWNRDAQGRHTFPPMIRYVRKDNVLREIPLRDYSSYTDLMRNCAAVISKPGGATLNDSLAYGIPFVMLEPFGEHEHHNSIYWEACGFGIRFAEWKARDFSVHHLEGMHRCSLEQRSQINHYGRNTYAAENSRHV
ncbi:hypothetical protein JCM10914A_49320 [Paenibacillus sp. JCM 10914]|uniref:hypothetical protein n=1 Tax=Paenibacillus sp. JCM 10914 TaxID=1236974 RepID=UPI0003CC773E|nr:hypothetical protein [Paenibacillus sp. JCM 10914]GAE08943.1 similar to C-ter. fragment of UDP-glucuronosyltransferases, YpfP B.subtilis related [Paenibacillus sp. JCM 10914]